MSKFKVGDIIIDKWGDIGIIKEINIIFNNNKQNYQIFYKKTNIYINNILCVYENNIKGKVLIFE